MNWRAIVDIYLAGGLFNAGERLHNLYLEKYLKDLGYRVILPQREALKFFRDDYSFDVAGIVDDCRRQAADRENICVCGIDGTDADSGTAMELGVAITATGRAVVYRTDFRTDLEKEIGVNAMLRPSGSIFIYEPCFFTELSEVDDHYKKLAQRIHEAVTAMTKA